MSCCRRTCPVAAASCSSMPRLPAIPRGLSRRSGDLAGDAQYAAPSSRFWTSPREAYEISNQADALYVHLLFAIISGEARYISAPFASTVLDLFHTLELRAAELVYDVRQGTLRGVSSLDPKLRRSLERQLVPQPALASWLADELSAGCADIARRLFPSSATSTP